MEIVDINNFILKNCYMSDGFGAAFFKITIYIDHEKNGDNGGDGAHNEGRGNACCSTGGYIDRSLDDIVCNEVEEYGTESERGHCYSVVGTGILGPKQVGAESGVKSGGAAVCKGDQRNGDKVSVSGNECHEDSANERYDAENMHGVASADLIGQRGHDKTSGRIGNAGKGDAGNSNGGSQSADDAEILDEGNTQIPGSVDEEDGEEQSPECGLFHSLGQSVVYVAGNRSLRQVKTGNVGIIRKGDEEAGDDAENGKNAGKDKENGRKVDYSVGIAENIHESGGNGRKDDGGKTKGTACQTGGQAALVRKPLLDAGDAGTVCKAGAETSHYSVSNVQHPDGRAGEKRRESDTG